jgi:hypothetical protein
MKKRDINLVGMMLMMLSVSIVSCKTTTKLYPYHASVEEIYNLSSGMQMGEVEKTLGSIKPFDVKVNFEDGYKIVEYKYKQRFQKVPIKRKNNPEYVSGGKEAYKEGGSLYVIYDTKDKMVFYITDSGKKRAQSSLATANDLNLMKTYPQFFNNEKKGASKSSGITGKKRKKIFGLF